MVQIQYVSTYNEKFDPYLVAIGRVALSWSDLEYCLNDILWQLLNVQAAAGACVTAQLIGPGPRFRAIVALLAARRAPAEIINIFNSLSSEGESLARQRNRYLHDPAAMKETDDSLHRLEVTADRKLKFDFVEIEKDKIIDLADKIVELEYDLDRAFELAIAKMKPWPRTEYELDVGIRRHRSVPKSSPEEPELPLAPSPESLQTKEET